MVKCLCLLLLVGCNLVPTTPNSQVVYNELIEAGCLASSDASLLGVQQGVLSDAQPPWFSCLVDGGSINGCNVPCGDN